MRPEKYVRFILELSLEYFYMNRVFLDYVFDGHENDNIRWMNNDIAVVKIEDGFDFSRRVRGCDFVPKPICYNNQSQTLENPGTVVSIAGWGTTSRYNDVS